MIKIVQDDMTKTLQDQMGCYISFGLANDISHAVVVYNYEGVEESVFRFEICLIMIGIRSFPIWYIRISTGMAATWPIPKS